MARRRVPSKWIRSPADELAVREGCYFDPRPPEMIREFLGEFCRQSIDVWQGQPLELIDWQWDDFVGPLYGWHQADGRRRFKSAYLQVAKKNGKSTLISGLSIAELVISGVGVPTIYLAACDKKQTGIVYDELVRMIEASPELLGRLRIKRSDSQVFYDEINGKIEALSKIAESKDGFNPSLVIFDELHRHKSPDLWNVMLHAGAARRNKLRIAITTAGTAEDVERNTICYQQYRHSKRVLSGEVPDTTHLAVIYEAGDGDPDGVDIDDPAVWRAANPSMGATIDEREFRAELETAKLDPLQLQLFLQLRLNLWVSGRKRLFSVQAWRKGNGPVDLEALRGRPCYGGLDLSSTLDMSAFALVFPDDAGESFDVLVFFWLPSEAGMERERLNRPVYMRWASQGLVKMTDGAAIDYRVIRDDINALAALYDLRVIEADPDNATHLLTLLGDEDGIKVELIRQGGRSLNAPTKELLRLVVEGLLRHGGNEVLAWMAGNAVGVRDSNDNLRLDKEKSGEKIDGMAALVNALAGYLLHGQGGGDPLAMYLSRGLLWLGDSPDGHPGDDQAGP